MVRSVEDPSATLVRAARALHPEIRGAREAIERGRRLPAALVERMRDAQLFQLWLPRALGGPELHPRAFVAVIEELASADGSVGWCAGVAGTWSVLAGSLPEAAARDMFADRQIAAGSFKIGGTATTADGGFRISGGWDFGSGIDHSAWLVVNCMDDAKQQRFAFVPTARAQVIDTWRVCGLCGTGSHDYRIDDVLVPAEHTTVAFVIAPVQPGTLYRYPFRSLAATSLAAVCLGIARGAIAALVELAETKTRTGATSTIADQPRAQAALGRAEALVRAARASLNAAIDRQWDEVAGGDAPTVASRVAMRLASSFCAEACTEAVDLIFRTAGSGAIYEGNPLARCFRDVHTATQHVSLSLDNYEHAGRVLFGGDPGPRF
jgi:alkylation response protein AidB-like acyl-CoA dehydrogenase